MAQQLSKKAMAYWRAAECCGAFVLIISSAVLLGRAFYWQWHVACLYIFSGIIAITCCATCLTIITLRKRFHAASYHYDEQFIYIEQGVIIKRFVMIPVVKIQAASVIEGPLLDKFDLACVEIQGIEKVYHISPLDKAVARQLHKSIAHITYEQGGRHNDDETISASHCV